MALRYRLLDSELSALFGYKDLNVRMLEVIPSGVILPPWYRPQGERIRSMDVRPDDVWVVSYPRTGSTMVQEMVWCIGNDLDMEKARVPQQFRCPQIELSALMGHDKDDLTQALGDSVDLATSTASPRYLKSHLTWDLLPEAMLTVKPKVVYVARNPKDMCVSYYHYSRLLHRFKGDLQQFAQLLLTDRAPMGPFWRHVLSFWEKRDDRNVLFLKYEDLKRDLRSQIHRTADFLGKTISEDGMEVLLDHLSFDKMKENPAVNIEVFLDMKFGKERSSGGADAKFIRKGVVGDYKNHMTEDMVQQFDAWTEENLRGTGLSFE